MIDDDSVIIYLWFLPGNILFGDYLKIILLPANFLYLHNR